MAGLRFLLTQLLRETRALKTMGHRFFDPRTTWVLDQFMRDLTSIGRAREATNYILELRCLHTKPSRGYEPGCRRGNRDIYAVVSGVWKLRPLGQAPRRKIEFCGIASTRIELYESHESNPLRLAMWRLELGAEDSPGCYVHAQILGDSDRPPFPNSVSIPRFPSIFVTPMSAVEFVLGELFQDEWAMATATNARDAPYWRALQRCRLQSLLTWYQRELRHTDSSPWMKLKSAKPDVDLFVGT